MSPREILWRILTGSISRAHLREKRLYDGSRRSISHAWRRLRRSSASMHRAIGQVLRAKITFASVNDRYSGDTDPR